MSMVKSKTLTTEGVLGSVDTWRQCDTRKQWVLPFPDNLHPHSHVYTQRQVHNKAWRTLAKLHDSPVKSANCVFDSVAG